MSTEDILNWRASIDPLNVPEEDQRPQKRKRCDLQDDNRAQGDIEKRSRRLIPGARLQRLPTPPSDAMSLPSHKRSRGADGDSAIEGSVISEGSQDTADSITDMEATPKADHSLQRQIQASSRTNNSRASPSHSTRSVRSYPVSRRSSPVKQQRNAALQDTGFETASFEMGAKHLPPQLAKLTKDLTDISYGVHVLPHDLQTELGSHNIPSFAFREIPRSDDDEKPYLEYRYPDSAFIRDISIHADKCLRDQCSETLWNIEVHRCVLEWVLRMGYAYGEAFIDFVYCPSAQINSVFKPEDGPSKMVDFCIFVQPLKDSPEHDHIIKLCRSLRPNQSINHTDSGSLYKDPIAISIETKRHGENWTDAVLQMGTWHAAQLRSIEWTVDQKPHPPAPSCPVNLSHDINGAYAHAARRIEFVPGIIIQGHTWKFVATVRGSKGKRPVLYDAVPLGDTQSAFGVIRLCIALQRLKFWVRDEFWAGFRSEVLGFDEDALA
ncbi:hypothetical protein B0I35DRAFT_485055 [Stachybotrys elegans]|uniref:PD-(D/E)XK nuclease-like domain-containing protein n=1 Tax=Stachybotrys elegans TaxID=80388 RepID=A0A8K0SB59_9HYPO|nr:hypothetical protein B0I35DRAFT_485055 [Stachybotrys elegans]